jgi:hypothetical protein
MDTIYYTTGSFNREYIDEYIKGSMSNKQYKILTNIFQEFEEYIEYKSFTISNSNGYSYNELFLFDINSQDNKYMPVYVQNINTSSPYALMRLETDYEDEEDKYISIDEFKNLIMEGYDIDKICSLIL